MAVFVHANTTHILSHTCTQSHAPTTLQSRDNAHGAHDVVMCVSCLLWLIYWWLIASKSARIFHQRVLCRVEWLCTFALAQHQGELWIDSGSTFIWTHAFSPLACAVVKYSSQFICAWLVCPFLLAVCHSRPHNTFSITRLRGDAHRLIDGNFDTCPGAALSRKPTPSASIC